MMNKQPKMLTLFIILLNAAVVTGYVLAEKPQQDQCWLYDDPGLKITAHQWMRDQALAFLKLDPKEPMDLTVIDSDDTLGTSTFLYESSELTVQVTYSELADGWLVDVYYMGQSWNLRVSQLGECTLIE